MVFIFLAYFTLYNGLQFHPSLGCSSRCLILCNQMDGTPSGSSTHETVQARIVDCVAISLFSSNSILIKINF